MQPKKKKKRMELLHWLKKLKTYIKIKLGLTS